MLNPLTLPLNGSQLIEASAGTGKTWTIAALYLRLVLGHGGEALGFARPLVPGEILVMTFTKAATRELSDRIRRRLVEAAACFRGEAQPHLEDTFLPGLLEVFPAGTERQAAAWRLAMAAEAMDDAAVYTIDAWCQRMLREHAFDSGCLFDEELQANEAAMRAEAARDYWRQQVYPLSDEVLAVVLAKWSDVDALLKDVRSLIDMPLPPGAGQGSLAECIVRSGEERAQALAVFKSGWALKADEMLVWLEAQWARKDCPINKKSLGVANGKRWLAALKDWAADPAAETLALGVGAQRLTRQGVIDAFTPGMSTEVPAVFAAFAALMAALPTLPELGPSLRAHAAARVVERVQHLKAQAGAFGFADMLDRLHAALDETAHGAKAQRLRQRIVQQYPAALIDEFQDTSPVQLGIFNRLYRIADNDPSTALLLIGDPKQSIYGFRGADIRSYLGARLATSGRHHVLGTNHRSTNALVGAVNFIFQAGEERAGEGAFMFGRVLADGAAVGAPAPGEPTTTGSALPFIEVSAKGRDERLLTSAGGVPAVTVTVDGELRGKPASRELFAALCAERIVCLLNDAGAGFEHDTKPFARLKPADIAVLVRTGTEAAAVRHALRQRGVASVYLSDKDTVFETDEAADLLRLLQAVAAPRDVRLARAALATSLLGSTLEELVALSQDEELFDRQCDLLRLLNATWQTQGVLAMVRRALHGFGLPARQLASPDGERRLTNVLHLAELLQAASAQVEGEQALIRWLSQQIVDGAAGQGGGDEQVLRLESDADLVKVVTVHKSKGLEYPLVFLPFAAHFRGVERRNTSEVKLVDEQGHRHLSLSPTDEQLQAADKDRQREDLRLLYVALTRACHALWVGASALKIGKGRDCIWHRSAIGYLVSGTAVKLPEQVVQDVQNLAAGCHEIRVETVDTVESVDGADESPMPPMTRLASRAAPPPLAPAPTYEAAFDRNWSISSYSALVRDAARGPTGDAPELPTRIVRDDEPAEAGSTDARRPADQSWHRFPRGAFAGNFLHDQLEWLAGDGFALDANASLQQGLIRRCERQGWGHRSADVVDWLKQVCTRPVPALGIPLSGLSTLAPEMEFWFPSDGLRASAVDRLCRQHIQPGQARPVLPERALQGMLMGFADLVFEHEGRYWVLDYKSNALGSRDADYTVAAMQAAMLQHRYDVQAVLYMLALHRLLKVRLGTVYDPAQHLGGAIYLFLRGVNSATGGCCHVPPSVELIEALDATLVPLSGITSGIATSIASEEAA